MPTVILQLYYDNAYATSYSTAEKSAAQRIAGHQQTLNARFQEFGIYVVFSTPTLSASYVETIPNCKRDDGDSDKSDGDFGVGDRMCVCVDNDECKDSYREKTHPENFTVEDFHHTNYDNNLFHCNGSDNPTVFNAYFNGNTLCSVEYHARKGTDSPLADKTADEAWAGRADPYERRLMVTNRDSESSEGRTLIHEFGHILGAPDHYAQSGEGSTNAANSYYNTNLFNDNCIYGHGKFSMDEDDLTICAGCQSLIRDTIADITTD